MKTDNTPRLHPYVSNSSFVKPNYIPPASAWLGHAPFAFWLVEALEPKTVVELGTHYGFSYFCLCQQIKSLSLPAQCVAVDTWLGDEHAGFYSDSVFKMVEARNTASYSTFSRLMRMTFDDALQSFTDGSIDLLHIDGRHRYEDVRHDFESWLPKLSNRSVVLFHDTQERRPDFGVFRYWAELGGKYPHFEFTHSHGLGVLATGTNMSPVLRLLFDASRNPALTISIQHFYERLGMAIAGIHLKRNDPCPCGSGKRFKHCCGFGR
jgi:methyltransferase family protein/SEC-C motif-containing protein